MSNFRLTDPRGLGLIAIGDIERRVAKVRRVGDGDIPYCKRKWRLLVGDGDEQLFDVGSDTCNGFVNSSAFLNDQLSFMTSVRSS